MSDPTPAAPAAQSAQAAPARVPFYRDPATLGVLLTLGFAVLLRHLPEAAHQLAQADFSDLFTILAVLGFVRGRNQTGSQIGLTAGDSSNA